MIAIDLGNKHTIISNPHHTLHKQTTITIQVLNQLTIGLSRNFKQVIYDLIVMLGTKYMDQQFGRYTKFYRYDYFMNKWGKIQVAIPKYQGMKQKKINCQTIVAMYLRELVREFKEMCQYYDTNGSGSGGGGGSGGGRENIGKIYNKQNTNINTNTNKSTKKDISLTQYLKTNKFYITVSGLATHPYRYAINQVCQISGIQTPIIINSSHMAVCAFYNTNKKHIKQPQIICLIQFGDKGSSIAYYRLQSHQQKIIEVIEYKGVKIGGYHLTKTFAEYVINQIKNQKGLDITRHSVYMSMLHTQCQKIKINIIESEEKEGHIRIPDLPDDSQFGRTINQKLLMKIFQEDIGKVTKIFEESIKKYKNVSEILVLGGSTAIPLFENKIKQIAGKDRKIIKLKKQNICQGVFAMQNEEITLFDVSESNYEVVGEEGFKRKLMDVGQDIPDRRCQKTKFPAGELEFNLRVHQNGVKIAHFILQARPKQTQFGLNFEIDRNKLIQLHVRTQKGRIDLPVNFQAISAEQIQKQILIIKGYQQK